MAKTLAVIPTKTLADSPATRRDTPRSLGQYYQRNGTGNPVAPNLDDPSIDIDTQTKKRYINYVADATNETNKIAVSRTYPEFNIAYGTNFQAISQDPEQEVYASQLEPSVGPSSEGTNWFPASFTTPEVIGTYYKDKRISTRTAAIQQYMTNVAIGNAPSGSAGPIDQALLNGTGYNETNKFIPQNVQTIDKNPVNGPEYKRTLGSTGFQKLGVFTTSTHVGQQGNSTSKNTKLTISDLEKIGLNLLFDSVQGEAGFDFKIESETDFTEAEARMAVPSLPRIGKKTSLSRFTPATTLKKLSNGEYNPSGITHFYDNTNDVETFGSFYSPYNQFDSLISLGQIALAIAMILAFVLLLEIIAAIMYALSSDPSKATTIASINVLSSSADLQQLLGASKISGKGGVYPDNNTDAEDFFAQLLGASGLLGNTYHNSGTCLDVGIAEFFGFSFGNQGRQVSSVASTALRILIESGRMTTTLREILRSGISVVEGGIADFSGGFSIAALGKLIRKIVDLKIIKFIKVLRELGDKVLFESEIREQAKSNGAVESSGSNVSYIDSLPDAREYYIAKSRLRNNSRKLAWSTETAGMLSLPFLMSDSDTDELGRKKRNLQQAISSNDIGQLYGNEFNSQIWGSSEAQQTNRQAAQANGRIDPAIVAAYEDILESDYMPFYIQDLRTNEILSFHAFLEDAGEDFNIDYTTVDGYGRLDKVHIYKGTTRSVNVTFKMIATNPEDHAIMWYKINKLVMAIYPQWTQGREINFGSGENALNFTQPFSQIPGATPVIRLRLGDIWKSNYSTMAVARLFGATTLPNYKVDNSPQPSSNTASPDSPAGAPNTPQSTTPARQFNPTIQEAERSPQPSTSQASLDAPADTVFLDIRIGRDVVLKYEYNLLPIDQHYTTRNSADRRQQRAQGRHGTNPIINPGEGVRLIAKCREISSTGEYKFQITHLSGPTPDSRIQIYLFQTNHHRNGSLLNLSDSANFITINESKLSERLDINQTNTLLARARQNEINRNQTTQNGPTIQMTTRDFYSETSNPIIKAFKSSGGKGLAGVITQFKIDTKDTTWGTSTTDKLRAPIMVTINLTMAVIHDITPGLDANGIMNAPVWPVGEHSNFFMAGNNSKLSQRATGHYYFNNSQIRRR
jgi:hypothetical protein